MTESEARLTKVGLLGMEVSIDEHLTAAAIARPHTEEAGPPERRVWEEAHRREH